MAQWVGAQGQVKVAKNTPTCGFPPQKKPTENEKIFFSISTTRLAESIEGLSLASYRIAKFCKKSGARGT